MYFVVLQIFIMILFLFLSITYNLFLYVIHINAMYFVVLHIKIIKKALCLVLFCYFVLGFNILSIVATPTP